MTNKKCVLIYCAKKSSLKISHEFILAMCTINTVPSHVFSARAAEQTARSHGEVLLDSNTLCR